MRISGRRQQAALLSTGQFRKVCSHFGRLSACMTRLFPSSFRPIAANTSPKPGKFSRAFQATCQMYRYWDGQ